MSLVAGESRKKRLTKKIEQVWSGMNGKIIAIILIALGPVVLACSGIILKTPGKLVVFLGRYRQPGVHRRLADRFSIIVASLTTQFFRVPPSPVRRIENAAELASR
jgi:hypothetical protein